MKRAGAKNDGAWYRCNKQIGLLTSDERQNLAELIAEVTGIGPAFEALQTYMADTGVALVDGPIDETHWAVNMATNGIPRQVWYGKLTTTTYTKVNGKWRADHQTEMHAFGKNLRRMVRQWVFARREAKDVLNNGTLGTGNPGGLPDDNPSR